MKWESLKITALKSVESPGWHLICWTPIMLPSYEIVKVCSHQWSIYLCLQQIIIYCSIKCLLIPEHLLHNWETAVTWLIVLVCLVSSVGPMFRVGKQRHPQSSRPLTVAVFDLLLSIVTTFHNVLITTLIATRYPMALSTHMVPYGHMVSTFIH